MLLLFISSGILLGLLLGYQDMSIIFEAIEIQRTKRRFVPILLMLTALVLGVMTNQEGTSVFVADLAQVEQLKVGFLILLSALIATFLINGFFQPVSITHTVIGAIFGWLLFSGKGFPLDKGLYIILIWLLTPLLSFLLASRLLWLSNLIVKRSKLHIFKLDYIFQVLTLIAAFFAVYSFAANNAANITAVFRNALPSVTVEAFHLKIPEVSILFMLAAISIAIGFVLGRIYTKSSRVFIVFKLSPEVNLSVLLAYTVVFFLFSSQLFQSGLHAIGLAGYDLVPLSNFYVLTGALVGVSIKGGFSIYKQEAFVGISINALISPLIAGVLSFFAFFGIQKIVDDKGGWLSSGFDSIDDFVPNDSIRVFNDFDSAYKLGVIGLGIVVIMVAFLLYKRMRARLQKEQATFRKQTSALETEKAFFLEKLKYEQKSGERLKQEVELRNQELEKFALQLIEKEKILAETKGFLLKLRKEKDEDRKIKLLDKLNFVISDSLNLTRERELFYSHVSNVNSEFFIRISQQFNQLTENDKRLIALLKLGLSSKEVGALFSITTKSVEMNRYRLRKKLNVPKEQNLVDFVNEI